MKSNVKELKDKVFIENIPRLVWGRNTDNSFIRSTQLTLNSFGENYTYDFLMGISGAAFRLHFHPDFCASSADSTTGFDVSKILFKSLGHNCDLHKIDDNSFEDINGLYQRIISQINDSKPIVAINLKVCPEWGIITGYLKDRPGILCRTYFDESEDYSLAEHAPWLSFFIGDKKESLDTKDLVINSLKIAIQLAETDSFENYYSGFAAFIKWNEVLKKYSDSKKKFDKIEENWTLFNILLDSRRSAYKYLDWCVDIVDLKNGKEIIENYKREMIILSDLQENILPDHNSKPKEWTPEILSKQIDCLTKALEIERENIELIEKESDN